MSLDEMREIDMRQQAISLKKQQLQDIQEQKDRRAHLEVFMGEDIDQLI